MADPTPARGQGGWRHVAFPLLAALFALAGLLVLEGLTEGLMPWVILGCPGCDPGTHPELHRWHGAEHGAFIGLLASGSLLCLLWRGSARPLLLQFYVLCHLILVGGFYAFAWQPWSRSNPVFVLILLMADGLLIATYPAPRAVFDFRLPGARSRRLRGLALLSALALAPRFGSSLWLQVKGTAQDEHVRAGRWAEALILYTALVAAGWLASTRRGGWKQLGVLTGLTWLYLGAAALSRPEQAGSWGVAGGLASLMGGLAYIGATLVEARPASEAPQP